MYADPGVVDQEIEILTVQVAEDGLFERGGEARNWAVYGAMSRPRPRLPPVISAICMVDYFCRYWQWEYR